MTQRFASTLICRLPLASAFPIQTKLVSSRSNADSVVVGSAVVNQIGAARQNHPNWVKSGERFL